MKPFPPRKGDLPRDALMQRANVLIAQFNGRAVVYFKFTCPDCGERCQFQEPNKLYETGICCRCGADKPVRFGGFSLELKTGGD